MTDYTNLLERLAVSAGDQECLYADAKAAIEALQTRVAEAEDTNKALRVRLGSELHEPVTTVEDRYNDDGKSCHITDDLPAGMKLYADPPVAAPVRLTDKNIDRALSERVPGGSEVRDWFLPHDTDRGHANILTVVRAIETFVLRANGFKVEGEQ